jgi:hypothetical protein
MRAASSLDLAPLGPLGRACWSARARLAHTLQTINRFASSAYKTMILSNWQSQLKRQNQPFCIIVYRQPTDALRAHCIKIAIVQNGSTPLLSNFSNSNIALRRPHVKTQDKFTSGAAYAHLRHIPRRRHAQRAKAPLPELAKSLRFGSGVRLPR